MKTFAKSEKDTFEIKNNLREAIYKSGLNITKVANKLGMTQGNLSQILSPTKNTTVSVYVMFAICEITSTNIHSILPSKKAKAKKPKTPTKLKMSPHNQKYVMLANDTITVKGQKVFRIKALEDFGTVTNIEDRRQYCHQMQSFYAKLIKQHKMASMAIRRKRAGV